jgi:serine/threonine protein kinase
VYGIASALAAFHAQGIVYGGLTTQKVFLSDNFEPILGLSGHSGFAGEDRPQRTGGSMLFLAPEILGASHPAYDEQSDIYSYGVLLYLMFSPSGRLRFSGGDAAATALDLKSRIVGGDRYMDFPTIPRAYWNLIERCWNGNATERPTIGMIVSELRNQAEYGLPGTGVRELIEYQDRPVHFDPAQ